MPKKLAVFVLSGVAWIFLLSIPVGQGKMFFDLAYTYLVDTKPVHWVFGQFTETVSRTRSASEYLGQGIQDQTRDATESTQAWYERNRNALSQSEQVIE